MKRYNKITHYSNGYDNVTAVLLRDMKRHVNHICIVEPPDNDVTGFIYGHTADGKIVSKIKYQYIKSHCCVYFKAPEHKTISQQLYY